VTLNVDGRARLFSGRAAECTNLHRGPDPDGPRLIFEDIIAANLAAFLAVIGSLYRAAGYHGHVDLGLNVIGLEGGYSGALLARRRGMPYFLDEGAFAAPTYPRTARVAAAELDDPEALTRGLLRHLVEATTGRDDFDLFAAT
jgi:hypothetical protein